MHFNYSRVFDALKRESASRYLFLNSLKNYQTWLKCVGLHQKIPIEKVSSLYPHQFAQLIRMHLQVLDIKLCLGLFASYQSS
jgi:hypothetical protein